MITILNDAYVVIDLIKHMYLKHLRVILEYLLWISFLCTI